MMRAKFNVTAVVENKNDKQEVANEQIKMMAVSSKPFDAVGNSEDNSFARWTPFGDLAMCITNPNLFGKIKGGAGVLFGFRASGILSATLITKCPECDRETSHGPY